MRPPALEARLRRWPAPGQEPHPALLQATPPRCPPEMALVGDDVCVDRWEASLVQVLSDGSEQAWAPYGPLPAGTVALRAVSKPGVVPQGYVSGEQAQQACANAGKRLCTDAEWTRACRGPEGTQFPYGSDRVAGICNDDGRDEHPVVEASRRSGCPSNRMWYEGMDNPLINQLDNTVQKTGARGGCTNRYGTFDMVGNLHEWIDDPAGTFRGGYFMDTWRNGEGCDYETVAHRLSYHDYSTGFRCCLAADPVE